ncbi:MAG: DUF6089 family protein [Bacteroidales bacterium]|jgi:hypothetical protein|nr:DUF6089 family protein [Bacteroidales bacterium]OJX88551.1 MAG: hypothetical protein BGP01_09420 [Paludibacter sp. 47-17]
MVRLLRYNLVLVILFSGIFSVSAQVIYTTEAGAYGGASYFIGDVDKKMLAGMKQDWGLTLRYVFNQRIALHADFHRTTTGGEYGSAFPALFPETFKLNHQVNFADLTMAFNFFDYGYLEHVMYSSNITPYIFGGLGAFGFQEPDGNYAFGATIPFGLGVKIRLTPRLHLNAKWTHRLITGSDRVEGRDELNDPFRLNGSNRLNRDGLGGFSIGFSVGLTQRDCDCQNYQ